MDKLTQFILKKYSRMLGDKKIHLGMSLSAMAREVRKSGKVVTGK